MHFKKTAVEKKCHIFGFDHKLVLKLYCIHKIELGNYGDITSWFVEGILVMLVFLLNPDVATWMSEKTKCTYRETPEPELDFLLVQPMDEQHKITFKWYPKHPCLMLIFRLINVCYLTICIFNIKLYKVGIFHFYAAVRKLEN